jgi:hypothetical protein
MDSSLYTVLDVLLDQRLQLEQRIAEIISQIRRDASRQATQSASDSAPTQTGTTQKPTTKKRRLSAAGRKAISDALRRRHAEKKAAQQGIAKTTTTKKQQLKRHKALNMALHSPLLSTPGDHRCSPDALRKTSSAVLREHHRLDHLIEYGTEPVPGCHPDGESGVAQAGQPDALQRWTASSAGGSVRRPGLIRGPH